MSCHNLKAFLNFQLFLIEQEAKRLGVEPRSIANKWIEKQGKEVRRVYCEQVCIFKQECKEESKP